VLGKQVEKIHKFQQKTVEYYELKKHKPWFDVGCSELLDEKKQAKLGWL
jgi:hypothetical protein